MVAYDVVRDDHGIPHLRAESVPALAFAQGYEAVRDRAWQLEIGRLRAEGRVAALLGPAGLEWDTFARRARLDETTKRAYGMLSQPTRDWLAAYAAGVSAAYADGLSAPELRDLAADVQPWRPWTPISTFLVRHVLFGVFPSKLWRGRVRDVLGEQASRLLRAECESASGSNAFVIGGGRTESGLPIVAGDPHRTFEVPNVYTQVQLTCPDFDVVGLALPGVPGIQHFGHAGSVAWAITNAAADYQDLYAETLTRDGESVRASGPKGVETVRRSLQQVDVRGADPVQVECLVTERGPVIIGGPGAAETYSLRAPSLLDADLGFEAMLPLLRSRSVSDVRAALRQWVEPVNNVVVGDRTGAIAHFVAGRVPRRAEGNRHGPVPADDAAYQWNGYLDELPEIARPSEPGHSDAVLVTANDRAAPSFAMLSSDFAAPHRADQLRAVLGQRRGLTVDDARQALLDVTQRAGAALLDQLAELDGLDTASATLRDRLLVWDRQMTADSIDAACFVAVRDAVIDRIGAAPGLAALRDPVPYGPLYAPALQLASRLASALPRVLAAQTPFGLDLPELVRAALAEVAADPPMRPWGDRHRYHPLHDLEQLSLTHEVGPPRGTPLGGDADCVACTGAAPGSSAVLRGSVARYVWDLADRDASRWAVPLGASGDAENAHSTDQFEAWRTGALLPMITDWAVLERAAPANDPSG